MNALPPRQRRIMTAQSKDAGPCARLAFQPRASSRRGAFRNPHYSRKTLFRDLPRTGGFLMRSTPYIYSWTTRPLQPPAAPAGKIPLNQRLAVVFQTPVGLKAPLARLCENQKVLLRDVTFRLCLAQYIWSKQNCQSKSFQGLNCLNASRYPSISIHVNGSHRRAAVVPSSQPGREEPGA